MDFIGLFQQLAKTPDFDHKIAARFQAFCEERKIPAEYRRNHAVTWNMASEAGAAVLAEIIGETMEKHPYLAKQAMKMLGGVNA